LEIVLYSYMRLNNHPNRKFFRKKLRNQCTPAENVLWLYLRNRQIEDVKFRRQHSYGPYIMDFYCPELRLCIELDGAGHFTVEGMERDELRTKFLKNANIEVLRFENKAVFEDIDGVIETIQSRVKALKLIWKKA